MDCISFAPGRAGLKKITGRCDIVICPPISAGVSITSLLEAEIKIPKQAEIMLIEHLSDDVQFSVPVMREYFDTGEVSKGRG